MANMGHLFSVDYIFAPYISLHCLIVLDSHCRLSLCDEANVTLLIWKTCRRNYLLLHQPPWIKMWGKRMTWELLQTYSEKREISSGMGPFTSSVRDSTLFVPADPLWFLLKRKRTQAWIPCSVCKPGEEGWGAVGVEGSSGSPGAWIQ